MRGRQCQTDGELEFVWEPCVPSPRYRSDWLINHEDHLLMPTSDQTQTNQVAPYQYNAHHCMSSSWWNWTHSISALGDKEFGSQNSLIRLSPYGLTSLMSMWLNSGFSYLNLEINEGLWTTLSDKHGHHYQRYTQGSQQQSDNANKYNQMLKIS